MAVRCRMAVQRWAGAHTCGSERVTGAAAFCGMSLMSSGLMTKSSIFSILSCTPSVGLPSARGQCDMGPCGAGGEVAGSEVAGGKVAGGEVAGSEVAGGEVAGREVAGSEMAGGEVAESGAGAQFRTQLFHTLHT